MSARHLVIKDSADIFMVMRWRRDEGDYGRRRRRLAPRGILYWGKRRRFLLQPFAEALPPTCRELRESSYNDAGYE